MVMQEGNDNTLQMMACSPRCIVIVIFILFLMLLGVYLSFISMAILNNGINKEIDRFSKENDRLEKINDEFTLNNDELQETVQDVAEVGQQLDVKTKQAQIQNVQFRTSLNNLQGIEADLQQQLLNLDTFQQNLNETALYLQYGITFLQASHLDLNATIAQIEHQISKYQDLRGSIEDYINGTDWTAVQAVQDFNKYVDKLKIASNRSIMLTLFDRASSAEKLQDGKVGFTQKEIDRLEIQTLALLNSTGQFQPPQNQFPKNQTAIVPTQQILQILQSYINSAGDSVLAATVNPSN
eukprot:TRINITY_DN4420_c1_g1_i5.p1 TRINITY_DN4420_c1_g1~~TRINITY_DN4420_c1_g1_i5.p1  ORF type:complete len:296 (-),score=41.24 TRINITY_DN4420_c1_g1_i5:165-1052(-)